ncbi:glycoside hydrolase family 95 protein [Thermophagus sp. OGC60D27]|uniref:glycoside hydrolase family 95 protein n=1 Tax=Thermophagus sp. OGC60D27 TaxID=3458415 RepID=UPI004037E44E
MRKILFLSLLLIMPLFSMHGSHSPSTNKLWYNQPAGQWVEALPIGNGRMGAMIFGTVQQERIQLNEESVWTKRGEYTDKPNGHQHIKEIRNLLFSGEYEEAETLIRKYILSQRMPSNTNTYQTLGDLMLSFDDHAAFSSYCRELDLEQAVASVSYQSNGVQYKREYFSSHPANATIIRLTADQPGKITFAAQLSRPGEGENVFVKGSDLVMRQKVDDRDGVTFETRVRVYAEGGTVESEGGIIKVSGSDEVMLIQVAATDFRGDDPTELCHTYLDNIDGKDFERLKAEHLNDYQSLFNRVSIDLGGSDAVYFPTDERLHALRKGAQDPALFALYYQFGRYLLISSSRPGTLPANLQGLWEGTLTPPWNADYHININLQMNYWPAEVTNLSECHLPFLNFIGQLRENGRKTAATLYGARGFTAHHTTDAWLFTTAQGQPKWGMWPMGAAWSATHFWEHFLFTGDTAFLKNYGYDVMKEAALFLSDFLVKDPSTGLLVSGPSMSPENTFITPKGNHASVVMGPSMDHQIIYHLFSAVINAAKVIDAEDRFTRKIQRQLSQLTPPEIGHDGRILEWSEELKEAEPGHRHMSHLYGLFPSNQFTWEHTPELMEAARKVIEERLRNGGGHTGWSRAWMVNFYARLKDGDEAYKNMRALLTKSTHPNLFDNHPPFQIDGNFGGTSGMTEMLLQSHQGYIELLPALPNAWGKGSITGVKARGGYTVNIFWDNNRLVKAEISSAADAETKVLYKDKILMLSMKKGETRVLDVNEFLGATANN